jgi:acyl transferase domain-containing protein
MGQRVDATPVAVVGLGAILPDAPDARAFWRNVKGGRDSISEVSPDRWDPDLYYDPDPSAPDKTYSKIGGWVRDWTWDPFAWRLPIPPRVGDQLDDGQKWAVACTRAALEDYGYPSRPLDPERTAVILGSAVGGEKHYFTSLRAYFPEYAEELRSAPAFRALPAEVQAAVLDQLHAGVCRRFPKINEDALPGELGNILAGRVANLFNFRGPSFTVDAACASGLAAINAAVAALAGGDVDVVVGGGIDRNMGANLYVKFSKIGALSATGSRPYAEGADGFVMGEGGVVFLLKRLADAEQAGDRIYAVIRGACGSSDGKGKGITAPNPAGQRLAMERAWRQAGVSPGTVGLLEGHGTSTRVGDVVELESLHAVFRGTGLALGSVALGSVKSNIGHLKAGAGAAGLLKTVLALDEKVLPPSLNFAKANPEIDFAHSPFRVNTELREWETPAGGVRRAGVSAFGFGGADFHVVVEEYVPGAIDTGLPTVTAVPAGSVAPGAATPSVGPKAPLRGALVIGADDTGRVVGRLRTVLADAQDGRAPAVAAPADADLRAPQRLAIDHADAAELADKASKALAAFESDSAAAWRMLEVHGVFRGLGPAPKVAYLYTGQGSQYVNMLDGLRRDEPVVAEVFDEADRITTPLLGRPLSEFIFVDADDPAAVAAAAQSLGQTAVTQPAVLTADLALTRLLASYGIQPDMVMGHSMGEYGALVAAGSLTFEAAIEAVSARGREVRNLSVADPGRMVAVFAPLAEIERIAAGVEGYVVVVNVNSTSQAVIGGATGAVERAVEAVEQAGFTAVPLPISHAFHTSIVAPACEPLRRALARLDLRPPSLPIVANLTGDLYPMGPGAGPEMLDILARHVASPVQFVKGLHTLHDAGARAFIEVGPKWALRGFAADVLGSGPDVRTLFTNHPKLGDVVSFNQALCGLYAAGLGAASPAATPAAAAVVRDPGPMIGSSPRRGPDGVLTVETRLDPAEQGFLRDHAMDGTPLLPGVMGIEAFAELALLPLPGWSVVAVEDVRFEAPFKFYRGEPRTVTLTATHRQEGDEMIADCRLLGTRKLATRPEPQVTTHFTGRVRLSRTPVREDCATPAPASTEPVVPAEDIYQVLFHGPAYRVLAREQMAGRRALGLLASGLPDNHAPASAPTVMSPRLIELCFQTAGIWDLATRGRFGLPLRVERVWALPGGPSPAAGPLSAVATARDDGAFDAVVVDEPGNVLLRLVGYHSVELPGAGGEEARRLLSPAEKERT